MRIIWSDDAIADYHQNINFVLENWSNKVAREFIEDVDSVIELIKHQPELYPLTGHDTVRRAVIRKQISLFFMVKDETIHLIRFWNNYQNPEKLKL